MSVEAPAAPAKLSPIERYRYYMGRVWGDPVGWTNQMFGVELWSKQQQVIEAVRDHPRVAVPSCNAAGKSFLAACVAHWYLASVAPGRVVLTGASWTGIEHVVWPWVKRLHGMALEPLGGTLMESVEWDRGLAGGLIGVAATDAERISGFRSEHGVLVIVDESSALSAEVHNAIVGLSASEGSRVLYIGNPLWTVGPFVDVCKPNSGWHVIPISAFDVPNVVTGRNIIPGLATRQWVEDCKREWGEDSADYAARVLGQFPETGQNSFFSGRILSDIERRDVRPCVWRGDIVELRDSAGVLNDYRLEERDNGPLRLWVRPEGDKLTDKFNYVIGCDVAAGVGASFSVGCIAAVHEQGRGEQVGEYYSNQQSPDEFAGVLDAMGRMAGGRIGRAFVIWENNGDGQIMGNRLSRLGYSYTYRRRNEEKPYGGATTGIPGWHSSPQSKRDMAGDYRGALARGEFVLRGAESVRECRDYIYYPNGGIGPSGTAELPEGERKAHGDRVTADMLACRGLREQPKAPAPPQRHAAATFADIIARNAAADNRREEW